MKNLVYLFLLVFLFQSCSTNVPVNKEENALTFEKNEEEEYDIIVFDPQYDVYLKTIARPKAYFSEEYYKMKNQQYVTSWNLRHSQPLHYDPDLYMVRIDYEPNINYGLNLEYKLFNFFKFIEWKYKVNLNFGG